MYVYVLTKWDHALLFNIVLTIVWAFFKMFFDSESREVYNIFENDFLPERIKKEPETFIWCFKEKCILIQKIISCESVHFLIMLYQWSTDVLELSSCHRALIVLLYLD